MVYKIHRILLLQQIYMVAIVCLHLFILCNIIYVDLCQSKVVRQYDKTNIDGKEVDIAIC